MIPAGAAGTPSDGFRVAREAADDVAGRLAAALAELEDHRSHIEDDAAMESDRPSFSDGRALGIAEAVDVIRAALRTSR